MSRFIHAPIVLVVLLQALAACAEPAARPAAIVEGYPAFDAPLIRFALEQRGVAVEDFTKVWLDTKEYPKYRAVVVVGDLARAGVPTTKYNEEDLARVRAFMEQGGALVVMRGNLSLFGTPKGGEFLSGLIGPAPKVKDAAFKVLKPNHPWVQGLAAGRERPWLDHRAAAPVAVSRGESLLGADSGLAILYRVAVGKGEMIYVGWEIAKSLPGGREQVAVDQEEAFEEQMGILLKIAEGLYPAGSRAGRPKPLSRPPYELPDALALPAAGPAAAYASHPPMRPLPKAMNRPLGQGRAYFVDQAAGDDKAAGSREAPWKTIARGLKDLRPGDTLCLRGGVYYERVRATLAGTADAPITIRSFPGELAVLDGGLREFHDDPAMAWEPCPDGAEGEFRSARAYPDMAAREEGPNVMGNFADSLVPLHGYRLHADLQSRNVFWNVESKMSKEKGIYCGPGLWFDTKSGRIHARLAHMTLQGLGDANYRGETDPRKLRLVVALSGPGSALRVEDSRHARFQDLVVRGACAATVGVERCEGIEFDGVTAYGGTSVMSARETAGLRLLNCALRGVSAPWTFRGHLKYRGVEARLLSASGWMPSGNSDFELAYSEFTDCIDGVFIGNVDGVRMHHSLLENLSDDGLFMTATTAYDGRTVGGNIHVYQNRLARCLTTFAYGVGHGRQKVLAVGKQTGAGLWVYRNVFDLRPWVAYQIPGGADAPQELTSSARSCGDHGSPTWEPMRYYHNTVLTRTPPFRANYLDGWGTRGGGAPRRLFNSILCQSAGVPGHVLPPPEDDQEADGNLHWSAADGDAARDAFLADLRRPPKPARGDKAAAEPPKARGPRAEHDLFADPKFARYSPQGGPEDLSLTPDSPAIDAGVPVPAEWPDPLRAADKGRPDIGAVPLGCKPWRIGIFGRLTVFGGEFRP